MVFDCSVTYKFSQLERKLCNLKLNTYFGFQFLCVEMRGAGLDQATKIKRARTISTGKGELQLKSGNTPSSRIPRLKQYREITRVFHTQPYIRESRAHSSPNPKCNNHACIPPLPHIKMSRANSMPSPIPSKQACNPHRTPYREITRELQT